ncbi:ankyrin-1-like [Trichogramma pretiosum]|uniref:ankyrin-1-like n=1 Tax=Trichogramma pretiosum TaxID=7493 RepID=UPI0006C984C6|nr:ankyrin-1-like [Trichogramma pretiosum]
MSELENELKRLLKNHNLEIKDDRLRLIYRLSRIICHWSSDLPNLQALIKDESIIENLLLDSVDCVGEEFIRFVALTGYRDVPRLDEDGQPIKIRTTPLHLVALRETLDYSNVIRNLFEIYNSFDVNYIDDESGLTHFHVACKYGFIDVIRKFLELCKAVNLIEPALLGYHRDVTELLLRHCADPNEVEIDARDSDNYTPLMMALHGKKWELVELLLQLGANPNLADAGGWTALHWICSRGNTECAKMLLERCHARHRPLWFNARDKGGNTPLIIALRRRDWELAKLLLQHGANPNLANIRGLTPLHEINDKDHDNYTECLTERFFKIVEDVQKSVQVNVNAQDKDRDTPLHLALRDGKKEEAKFLLSKGANPNLVNATGKTAMFIVCNRWSNEDASLELAEMVFEFSEERYRPLQLNVQDENGETALFGPVRRGQKRLVKFLLERGIDPNLASSCGQALHQTILPKCDVDVVRLIFEHSQERYRPLHINAKKKYGDTPLLIAAMNNRHEVVEFLLRRGADPNAANDQKQTSVHHLCKFDYMPQLYSRARALFEICAEIGQPVKIDAKDNLDRTPLQWAVANHSPMMVDLLLDRGANLSSFVFPTESYFNASFKSVSFKRVEKKFILASGMMAVVERLKARGYELDRSDTLMIMKVFSELNWFENSADLENNWYDDEEFATEAKQAMIKPNLSLYDLIQLRPDEARKRLSSMEYYEFARTLDWLRLPERLRDVCARHLCEKLSRRYFQRWALCPFCELIRQRLPLLCCEMILDELMNRDLHNICLAAC